MLGQHLAGAAAIEGHAVQPARCGGEERGVPHRRIADDLGLWSVVRICTSSAAVEAALSAFTVSKNT